MWECLWQKIVSQGFVIVANAKEFAAVPVATKYTDALGASNKSCIFFVTLCIASSCPYPDV